MSQAYFGRFVYPRKFAESVPVPSEWDHRPIPNLLRGRHSSPPMEIERIERWYKELKGKKSDLLARLRGLDSRSFWSAYYELMTSRVFNRFKWSSGYHHFLSGNKTPDFIVKCPSRFRFVAEVLTAFQSKDDENKEQNLHRVADFLNRKISHRVGVLLEEVILPRPNVNLDPLIPCILNRLNRYRSGGRNEISVSLPGDAMGIKLSVTRVRSSQAPIIEGVAGVGGEITSTDRIQSALRGKIKKYRMVKELKIPLVLFIWQGHWLKVTDTSLEWALYGRLQANITLGQPRKVVWSHAPGGLFAFGRSGRPAENRRLSAVVYCKRVWHEGKVYSHIQVYHHPYANHPIPRKLFKEVPQFVPFAVSDARFSCKWTGRHRGYGLLLK